MMLGSSVRMSNAIDEPSRGWELSRKHMASAGSEDGTPRGAGWPSMKKLSPGELLHRVSSAGSSLGRGPSGRAHIVPRAASPVARTTGDIERESSNEGLSHRTGATARSHNDVELAVTLEESLTDEGSGRR
jgi:hypothetical protein